MSGALIVDNLDAADVEVCKFFRESDEGYELQPHVEGAFVWSVGCIVLYD